MTKTEACAALLAVAAASVDEKTVQACVLGAKALARAAVHRARNRQSRKARGCKRLAKGLPF